MTIRFICKNCSASIKAANRFDGELINCPRCNGLTPAYSQKNVDGLSRDNTIKLKCLNCKIIFDSNEKFSGKKIQCPKCKYITCVPVIESKTQEEEIDTDTELCGSCLESYPKEILSRVHDYDVSGLLCPSCFHRYKEYGPFKVDSESEAIQNTLKETELPPAPSEKEVALGDVIILILGIISVLCCVLLIKVVFADIDIMYAEKYPLVYVVIVPFGIVVPLVIMFRFAIRLASRFITGKCVYYKKASVEDSVTYLLLVALVGLFLLLAFLNVSRVLIILFFIIGFLFFIIRSSIYFIFLFWETVLGFFKKETKEQQGVQSEQVQDEDTDFFSV